MTKYQAKHIFINTNIQDHFHTKQILERHPQVPHTIIETEAELKEFYEHTDDPISTGKQYLYLTENKGRFLKKCPGTQGFICCNYYVIDLIENCHFECRYCFLQGYLNSPIIKIYVNLAKLFKELDALITDPRKLYRIGTGELSDSLALDPLTGFSELLVSYFATKENAILELKTKSNQIDRLLKLKSQRRTVIGWSLSPEAFIAQNETHTASLTERLRSAELCIQAGYQIALHLDPIIHHPDWETTYQELIEQIFQSITPQSIAWISMGSLRYTNRLKDTIEKRFPSSEILNDEFFESPDGKHRYFVKLRERLYTGIKEILLKKDPTLMIYLCMESKHMWKRVYPIYHHERIDLDKLFKKRQEQIHAQL